MPVTCQLSGGLGNQLFQIATTCAVAWDNGDTPIFDLNNHIGLGQGNTPNNYKNTIYKKLITDKKQITTYNHLDYTFNYTPIKYHNDMMLYGYYQSEKYFQKYRDVLLNLLIPLDIIDVLKIKYKDINFDNSCAVHVRRGDYVRHTKYLPLTPINYFNNAMKLFPNNTNFMIFSDDINWCRENFKNVICVELENDIETLFVMSLCKHQIISNSTFSWWASYFNKNSDKKIIAPKKWFNFQTNNDIHTPNMILL